MEHTRLLIGALGAFFLGAVYLSSLVAFGLITGNRTVFAAALIAAGAGYLVQVGSIIVPLATRTLLVLWGLSVSFAVIAGLAAILGG